MWGRGRAFLATVATAVLTLAMGVGAEAAQAEFGVQAFDGQVTADQSGAAYTQAGGHPYEAWSAIRFNGHPDPASLGREAPDADLKTISVDLPPGLVGNPTAVQKCSRVDFSTTSHGGGSDCPLDSQIGSTYVELVEGIKVVSAVWNLTPAPNAPASFGFVISGVRVLANASVRTGGDYGVTLTFPNVNQGFEILGTKFALWGEPSDTSHDSLRCSQPNAFVNPISCTGTPGDPRLGPNSVSNTNPQPFLTNPTACTAPGVGLVTKLTMDSWQNPGVEVTDSFTSHLPPGFPLPPEEWGAPQGPTDCAALPFAPKLSAVPTSRQAGGPTGLDVTLKVPQGGLRDPGGLVTAHLKGAAVTLPEGMALNPTVANGMSGCSLAQIGLHDAGPASCPESSRVGSVSIETPLLERELEGSVYVATQQTNPFSSLLAIYLVAEDERSGVRIKLAGKVDLDPKTGQLVARFDDNPQLPFEVMRLHFNGGERAPLTNPSACGTYKTHSEFTSWAEPKAPVASDSSFAIDQGCARKDGFTPGFSAGTTNPIAGQSSPFTLRVTRPDGQQNVSTIQATLPEGVLAKLAGVQLCGDSDAASGNCPQASQVGSATVGVGAGSDPLYVPQPGKAPTAVYLAGPYKGAPYSLVAKVPAQAGPFDLGTVAVRNTIDVNPTNAQVSVKSDPLPQILQGIPISYRDIRVDVDRSQFTLNPTSCEPMEVKGTIGSANGQNANVSDRFQVASCEALRFKPKLALRLSGAPTRRGGYPKLRAVLTMPQHGANIQRAQVLLPKTEFLENAHIRTICTRVQYAAAGGGGKACPKASIYGYARAWSPLLDRPLQGPVYLRSSNHKLPDLVASLDGQIHIDLVGRIDAKRARIRNTFETVPDAPVSRFVLTMQGGKKGLLVNNTNICRTKPRANVRFDGQNGKLADSRPLVKVAKCAKKRK